MPNQNPGDISGATAMGRWDYGPWFWPPYTGITHGPIANPYYDPANASWEPPTVPGTPNPSVVPEAFMDTPLVNGTAYPYLKVDPKAYRFRILNACNDRTLNLQLYYAKSSATMWNADGTLNTTPTPVRSRWSPRSRRPVPGELADRRPRRRRARPAQRPVRMIQIGTEGGLLPAPVALTNQPVGYDYNRRNITVLNVSNHTLMLGPAERADVVVDFSQVPAGRSSFSTTTRRRRCRRSTRATTTTPATRTRPPRAARPRPSPATVPTPGPSCSSRCRPGTPLPAFDLAGLQAALPVAYNASQPKPIVPETTYDAAFGTTTPADTYSRIQDTSLNWAGLTTPMSMQPKAIQELFDTDYGRMNAYLGIELPIHQRQHPDDHPLQVRRSGDRDHQNRPTWGPRSAR